MLICSNFHSWFMHIAGNKFAVKVWGFYYLQPIGIGTREKVKKDFFHQLTNEQYNELEEVEILLISAEIQKITEALKITEKIFLDLKLYPK